MKKTSYEAWAVIEDDGKFRCAYKTEMVRLYENKAEAKLYAPQHQLQKVRVTIEPVKAKKKRKVTR